MRRSTEFGEPRILEIQKDGSSDADLMISEEELAERMDRLRTMGRTIGEDFAMRVVVGRDRGWRYKFKPINTIEVDPEDVRKRGLEYCFGVIAHEGAHRRVSRTDFIPQALWQQTGFSFLMNAVEDPRVNNWVAWKYGGARGWLEEVYREDLPPEEGAKIVAKKKMGYVPKHIRYGLEVIRYWRTGKFSEDAPAEVREVLDATIKQAERAYGMVPEREPTEEEIVRRAREMHRLVRDKIWPEYQKLVEESKADEAVRQMIKDMVEAGELSLPEEGMEGQEGAGEEDVEKGKPSRKGSREPLPLSEMPEDLRKEIERKLKEKLDGMSEEGREKFIADMEKKAGEILDELESELNNKIRGHFSDQPETKHEAKERKAREEADKEAERKRIEEIRRLRQEADRKTETGKGDYERAREDVAPYIDRVANDLMNIFIARRFPQKRPRFPGQTLRLRGAMKYTSRRDYKELFEDRLPAERPDYTFLLLVDLSSSMQGNKIEETFKGAVLFAEALARVTATIGTIKVAVYGFQDVLIPFKEFDGDLDDKTRDKMSIMKKEVGNQGEHNRAAYNNDGYCVEGASQILRQAPGQSKILVVLSDGQPCGDATYRVARYAELDQNEELIHVVEDISRAGDQYVLGVGLGSGTEHVSTFYRNDLSNVENIPNVNIRQLVEVLARKLEELIK